MPSSVLFYSKGKCISFIYAEIEVNNTENELKSSVDILGDINDIFYEIYDKFLPLH